MVLLRLPGQGNWDFTHSQSPQQIARKASYALSATSSMYPLIAAFCHVQAVFMLTQQPNIAWLVLEDAPSVLQETWTAAASAKWTPQQVSATSRRFICLLASPYVLMANIRFQVITHASPATLLAFYVANLPQTVPNANTYQELCISTMLLSVLWHALMVCTERRQITHVLHAIQPVFSAMVLRLSSATLASSIA